jgi:hypothetical protein
MSNERRLNNFAFWTGVFFITFCISAALFNVAGCTDAIIIDTEVDPCSIEGVEECCPEVDDRYAEGYRAGFTAAQEQDTHECPPPTHAKPRKPHKNTRGKGHIKHSFDLDSDDPLEGLPVSRVTGRCTETCFYDNLGRRHCRTVCRDNA